MLVKEFAGNQSYPINPSSGLVDLIELIKENRNVDDQHALRLLMTWFHEQIGAGRFAVENNTLRAALLAAADGIDLPEVLVAALAATGKGQQALARLSDLQSGLFFLFRTDEDTGIPKLQQLKALLGQKAVSLNLTESVSKNLSLTPDLTLKVAGSASAGLSMAVVDGDTAEKEYQCKIAEKNDVAMVISLDAELSARAESSWSVAKTSMKAEASKTLELIYQFDEDKTSLSAIKHVLGDLPSGFQLTDIAAKLDLPHQDGFRQLNLRKAAGFGFNLSASMKGQGEGLSSIKIGKDKHGYKMLWGAAANVALGWQSSAGRDVLISKDNSGALNLKSVSRTASDLDFAASLSAGISVDGLDRIATNLIKEALPDATKLIDELNDFTSPGTWFAPLLDEMPDNVKDVLGPLLETGDGDEAARLFEEFVSAQVNGRVDIWSSLISGQAEDLVDTLLGQLPGNKLESSQLATVRNWLINKATSALNTAKARLTDFLQNLTAGPGKIIADGLKDIGKAIKKVENKVEKLLAPVLSLLEDYGNFRSKLLGAVDKALKIKLQLALSWTYSREVKDTLTMNFVIPEHYWSDSAKAGLINRDFKRWLNGKDFEQPDAPFGLVGTNPSWLASSERLTKIGELVTIDLGSVIGSSSVEEILKSSTKVEVGPSGVIAVITKVEAKESWSWRDEAAEATLTTWFNALSGVDRLARFGLDLSSKDQALNRDELESLLASLGELTDDAGRQEIRLRWAALAGAGKTTAAALNVSFHLEPVQRAALMRSTGDSARLQRGVIDAMVAAASGRPGRDLRQVLRMYQIEQEPSLVIDAQFDSLKQRMDGEGGYGPGRLGYKFFGQQTSPNVGGAVQRAAESLAKSLRPIVKAIEAFEIVSTWPDGDKRFNEILGKAKGKSDYEKAFNACKTMADEFDGMGVKLGRKISASFSVKDVIYDRNDDIAVNSLFLIRLISLLISAKPVVTLTSIE